MDSTRVPARIRGLNRLELAGEAVRAALAAAAPHWLAGVTGSPWQQVYGARIDTRMKRSGGWEQPGLRYGRCCTLRLYADLAGP